MCRTRALLAFLAAALALTACGPSDSSNAAGGDDPTPTANGTAVTSPATSPPAPTTPAETDGGPDASPTPPFQANTRPDRGEPGQAGPATIFDIRVGRHDDFDRLVIEIGGPGEPGWLAQYVDPYIEDGSGNELSFAGDATLDVRVAGLALPGDVDSPSYGGARQFQPDATEVIREVHHSGVYESIDHVVLGLERERPFRVYRLDSPQRIVVEILH